MSEIFSLDSSETKKKIIACKGTAMFWRNVR